METHRLAQDGIVETKAESILAQISDWNEQGFRIFASSSFQTQSLPLLHILASSEAAVDIVFLDTGYHFPETLAFRDHVAETFGLRVINAKSDSPKSEQRTTDGRLLFASNVDQCCFLNKVAPLEPFLRSYDIWVSGVRADQSAVRADMNKTMPGPHGTERYHPMFDWSAKDIFVYRESHSLPSHPLEAQGYLSVGCMPCTRSVFDTPEKSSDGDARTGRWVGQTKTECGLHTELVSQRVVSE